MSTKGLALRGQNQHMQQNDQLFKQRTRQQKNERRNTPTEVVTHEGVSVLYPGFYNLPSWNIDHNLFHRRLLPRGDHRSFTIGLI